MAKNPLNNLFVARATLDVTAELAAGETFAASNIWSSATSAVYDPVWIPEGAIITRAFYYVTTSLTDGGDDDTTVDIGITMDDDCILTAALGVISDGTAANMNSAVSTGNLDAGLHIGLLGTPALGADGAHDTAVEVAGLSAALMQTIIVNQAILVTNKVDVLSAGKMDIYVEYMLTGDLS